KIYLPLESTGIINNTGAIRFNKRERVLRFSGKLAYQPVFNRVPVYQVISCPEQLRGSGGAETVYMVFKFPPGKDGQGIQKAQVTGYQEKRSRAVQGMVMVKVELLRLITAAGVNNPGSRIVQLIRGNFTPCYPETGGPAGG